MKHYIIKSLITLLVVACLPFIASAQYFESGGIVYGITSEQTVEVLSNYYLHNTPYSGSIVIPQTVEDGGITYTVTALAESAFESCTTMTSLTLPPTIRSIGSHCFYNCTFTTLQLPDSLHRIDDHAFLYSSISSLHLPACFEGYGECTFWARNLMSITVDEANPHFRSIDGWLYSKDSLTLCIVPSGETGAVAVPQFVQHLDKMAFGFCSYITSVTLPEGVVSIGDFAFNCCATVDGIVVPSTVTHIGVCPFSYCPQMNNLSIANGNSHYVMDGLMVYSAGYDTLVSCHKSGTTVILNPNVKVLGGFENNTWLRNIDIPSTVTDITENCFNGCQITTITLPAHMKSIGRKAFSENDRLTSVTMPQTLLSMGQGAFEHCYALTSIVIPDSLHIIPKEAFNSCIRLSSITWNNDVEEIGDYAFWALSQLSSTHITNLDLPASLRKVGDCAFGACTNNLRSVTFHGQIDTLGTAVFESANLQKIRFTGGLPPAIKGDGPLYMIGQIDTIAICGNFDAWLADSYWQEFADRYVEDCNLGMEVVGSQGLVVSVENGRIIVEGATDEVRVYDMIGRLTQSFKQSSNQALPAGVYLVKTGDHPARKVMVIR
ncbi:MAG: leucine-rich repeat domain-containing protein [Bacteroidales bacterium]|nr:leucine-rich repeat domain-containing protein [Bacteroidales bacterium]